MWGGRYAAGPAEIMERINASIDFDRRFYAQDIAGSKAHCQMLVNREIISATDGDAILAGLDAVLKTSRRAPSNSRPRSRIST